MCIRDRGTAFPQFEGSDSEGNPVDNSLFAGNAFTVVNLDRKSTRLNSSHSGEYRQPLILAGHCTWLLYTSRRYRYQRQ